GKMEALQDFFTQSPILAILFLAGIVVFVAVVLLSSAKENQRYSASPAKLDESEHRLDFQAHVNRGNEMLAQYNFDRALAHFQEAVKIKNSDPAIHFKIGRIFVQKED